MNQQRRNFNVGVVLVAAVLTIAGCSDDGANNGPSGGSVTITAPGIVSPANGSQVTGQVTFTVSNVTVSGGGTPTYTFQVASDSGFTALITQTSGVAQGAGGQTSWTAGGLGTAQIFWRARASVGATQGPFSSVGNFQHQGTGSGSTGGNTDSVLLFDSLKGGSRGDVGGGEFTDEGWKVIASSNFIVYDMPTIETGFFEFDIKGLDIRNPTRDARHLFFMWDPSLGSDLTSNRFRVSLQKLDGRSSINDRWLRLRFITQGRQIDVSNTFRGWTPERTYRVRIEWGQEGDVNACRVFIDGDQKMFFQYNRPYIPAIHRIELGAGPRAETPEGAIYSNVSIGTR